MTDLQPLLDTIASMRDEFTDRLRVYTGDNGVTPDIYHRYLSMQYHLTKGVQRYFFTAAAHASLSRMKRLRRFLCDFANEEELHYLVAANDLRALGQIPSAEPFDVQLWHAYFSREVVERPFVRLGAAAVLENLAGNDNRALLAKLLKAPFLGPGNTRFLVLHMHETLPHGEQILSALGAETLDDTQVRDLVEGAFKGGILYLRMVEWALNPAALTHQLDHVATGVSPRELQEIAQFDIGELAM
jgi:hypothetical protein